MISFANDILSFFEAIRKTPQILKLIKHFDHFIRKSAYLSEFPKHLFEERWKNSLFFASRISPFAVSGHKQRIDWKNWTDVKVDWFDYKISLFISHSVATFNHISQLFRLWLGRWVISLWRNILVAVRCKYTARLLCGFNLWRCFSFCDRFFGSTDHLSFHRNVLVRSIISERYWPGYFALEKEENSKFEQTKNNWTLLQFCSMPYRCGRVECWHFFVVQLTVII